MISIRDHRFSSRWFFCPETGPIAEGYHSQPAILQSHPRPIVPVSPSLCKNILAFIYAKARILIAICLLNTCTILKKGLWLADTQNFRICTSHLKDTWVNRSAP